MHIVLLHQSLENPIWRVLHLPGAIHCKALILLILWHNERVEKPMYMPFLSPEFIHIILVHVA